MNQQANRWTVIVVDLLFEPEIKNYHKQIDKLIQQNNELIGSYSWGFHHAGDIYTKNGYSPSYNTSPPLHPHLDSEFYRIKKYWQKVKLDERLIAQTIHKLLQPCETIQEIRNALPECLVELTSLKQMQRTREDGWTLQNEPLSLRQYRKKILPKIEMYYAMRFIY